MTENEEWMRRVIESARDRIEVLTDELARVAEQRDYLLAERAEMTGGAA